MILGNIQTLGVEKEAFAPIIQRGLAYLANTDFSKLEAGKYEIEGNDLFYLVQEFTTQPKEERKAETHGKYIDIQYLLEGEEIIGFALLSPDHEVTEDLLAEKDLIFYQNVTGEIDLAFKAGMYAIFFPNDIHRPGCMVGKPGRVKKVVLKIAVTAL